jgi:hypothetical protein
MSIHRSAKGIAVDMATLVAKNERTRAVGNMNVNARGDILDSHNHVIRDGTARVKASYTNIIGKPNQPVPEQQAPAAAPNFEELTEDERSFDQDDEDVAK